MKPKSNGVDIWMPLYIGDYLADTMHLTTEQHGAYILLLMYYWKNKGPLPADPFQLSAICKMSMDAWSIAQALLERFFDTESLPGFWVHKRVEKEMVRAAELKKSNVKRAKAGARARWNL